MAEGAKGSPAQPPSRAVLTNIIGTMKAEHADGCLEPTAKAISLRAEQLARMANVEWQPSASWIDDFKSRDLKLTKRAYGAGRGDPQVEQIMDFIRDSTTPSCSERSLQEYRPIIVSNLRAGLNNLVALQAARPKDSDTCRNLKLAVWRHMCRFYAQEEGGAIDSESLAKKQKQAAQAAPAPAVSQADRCFASSCGGSALPPAPGCLASPPRPAMVPSGHHTAAAPPPPASRLKVAARLGPSVASTGLDPVTTRDASGILVRPQEASMRLKRVVASCSPSETKEEGIPQLLSRVNKIEHLLDLMRLGGAGRPDLAIGVFCCKDSRDASAEEDAGYALNCLTLTVTGLAGRGELKTLQKHDQQLLDCLHVAWFWGRLREEDGTSEWGAAARRFFRADEDLVAIFPVLSSTVTGLSCGAAAVLAMLQWKTGCSFLPKMGVTGEVTLTGDLLKVGGITEKLRAVRDKLVEKVVLPATNREEARKEGALQHVVLVDDVKGMVEAVVQGPLTWAARLSDPLPPSTLACVRVPRSWGVQRVELAVAPGMGRVFITGLDASSLVLKSVYCARVWLTQDSESICQALQEATGSPAVPRIDWYNLTRQAKRQSGGSSSSGSHGGGDKQQLDLIINFPASTRQDSLACGAGVALGLMALSFGLPLPEALPCVHGGLTPSGIIAPSEEIDERLLSSCVTAKVRSVFMHSSSVDYLAAKMELRQLDVYQDSVQVYGLGCMYEAINTIFGRSNNEM